MQPINAAVVRVRLCCVPSIEILSVLDNLTEQGWADIKQVGGAAGIEASIPRVLLAQRADGFRGQMVSFISTYSTVQRSHSTKGGRGEHSIAWHGTSCIC